ncbi:MAG: Smr/MutS family protein [Nitrosomonas sp.]|nr:MAG: Smr/MutS family protein [Nitrosomonas sp.]
MCTDSDQNDDDMALFRTAMRDVAPLPASDRVTDHYTEIPPFPLKVRVSDTAKTEDSLSDHIALIMEPGDAWSYAYPGISQQTLRRLRRGYWNIQANLDLHGDTRDEARRRLSAFLDACTGKNMRCVRVIHGKGLSSKNQEPVLKTRIGNWLIQRADVLAFCQAKQEHGGGGAVLILLKASA